jgi:hypothetical protein
MPSETAETSPGTGHLSVEDGTALDVYVNEERATYDDAHAEGFWVEHRHADVGVTQLCLSYADGEITVSGEHWPNGTDAYETDGEAIAFRLVACSGETHWMCFEAVDTDRDLTVELRPRIGSGVLTHVERPELQWTGTGVQYRCRTGVNAAGGAFVVVESREPDDEEWSREQLWMADEPAEITAVEREQIVDAE